MTTHNDHPYITISDFPKLLAHLEVRHGVNTDTGMDHKRANIVHFCEHVPSACTVCGIDLDREPHATGCGNAYYCPLCSAQFNTDTELMEHTCGDERVPCGHCGEHEASNLVPALALALCDACAFPHWESGLTVFRLVKMPRRTEVEAHVLTALRDMGLRGADVSWEVDSDGGLVGFGDAQRIDWNIPDPTDGHDDGRDS